MAIRSLFRPVVLLLALPLWASAAEVTIDASVRFQTIEGWGTCLIGWSLSETPYNDPAWRAAYRDLGCNILRIPMIKEVLVANRQNPDYRVPVALGADLQANINLMNFRISPLTTWADIAVWLKNNALEPDQVKIEGSPWSPPHWMKGPTGASQSHVTNPSVSKATPWLGGTNQGDSIGGRLKTEDASILQMYGRYIAAWTKGFEQTYGVPFYVISLQNESTFENPFDSMTFIVNQNKQTDYAQYAMGLKSVKDAWQAYGLTTKIMGPHVANVGPTPDSPWALLSQMQMIDGVKNHADPGLIDFLDFYNSNYYMGTSEPAVEATAGYYWGKSLVPANWAFWAYAPGVRQDGKPIWYSETGDAQSPWLNGNNGTTPGDGAIVVAQKMHNALVWSDASAYVYWQMSDTAWNESEHTLLGRSHVANPHDSKKYCSFKHFSRYVRPGARRIQAAFANGRTSIYGNSEYDTYNGLNVSAFLHEQDRTFTCVLINMRSDSEPVTIHLPDVPVEALAQYRTSSTESFLRASDLPVSAGEVSLTVPSYSVVTLTGTLVDLPSPDLDGDGDVDQEDFGLFQVCLTGEFVLQTDPACANTDLDRNNVTDQEDVSLFKECMTGPGGHLDLSCLH